MSSLQDREKMKGILTILSAENTGPQAAQLRASAAELLRNTKPDHKLGRIITENPDVDILEYAAELHRGGLFRGGRRGSISALPLEKMPDIKRKNCVSILLKALPKSAQKSFLDLMPRVFAKQDTVLLDLLYEIDPVETRRLLLQDRELANLQNKHRLRRAAAKILEQGQHSDYAPEDRLQILLNHLSGRSPISVMAILGNGPVGLIPAEDIPPWRSWFEDNQALLHIRDRLSSAHGQMELMSLRIPYEHLLGPGGEAAILKQRTSK